MSDYRATREEIDAALTAWAHYWSETEVMHTNDLAAMREAIEAAAEVRLRRERLNHA